MADPTSPARRVLSDKTTNASLLRFDYENASKQLRDFFPSDSFYRPSNGNIVKSFSMPSMLNAGKKRTIDELDDIQASAERIRAAATSPVSMIPTEPNSETNSQEDPSTTQMKTSPSTLLTSFNGSQGPTMQLEDQFEIREEMSQKTLEKIHATPLLQNNSQPQLPLRPSLMTENSQDSVRMSSFIDSSMLESQENKEAEELNLISPTSASPGQDPARSEYMMQKAEALRTRLRLAMYKVNTNQTKTPFSRLKRPRTPPDLPDLPSMQPRPFLESIIADARSRATNQKKPPVRKLSSLPVPTMVPMTFAERYNLGEEDYLPPSTPTTTMGAGKEETGDWDSAGTKYEGKQPTTVMERKEPSTPPQLSSPPGSEYEDGPFKKSGINLRGGGLTSSVVKGEAATGLLELRRAGGAI